VTEDKTTITLRLFGPLRSVTGKREVQLPCAGSTVREALKHFATAGGNAVERFIYDGQGNKHRSIILLLNEEPISDGQDARLQAGDVISLLLPLAGGAPACR
jgi:molybdopterin converting factor small subunit